MNLVTATKTCFKKYAVFTGRATKSEFWFFTLFRFLFAFVVGAVLGFVIGFVMGGAAGAARKPLNSVDLNHNIQVAVNIATYIQFIFFLLPHLSVAVRRVHDTGRSGWYLLIPIYGVILMFLKSEPSDNHYGSSSIPVATDVVAPSDL